MQSTGCDLGLRNRVGGKHGEECGVWVWRTIGTRGLELFLRQFLPSCLEDFRVLKSLLFLERYPKALLRIN